MDFKDPKIGETKNDEKREELSIQENEQLQRGFSNEEICSQTTDGPSKLLKIIGIGEAEKQRQMLEQFGELNYL